jgi:hypothetical protein
VLAQVRGAVKRAREQPSPDAKLGRKALALLTAQVETAKARNGATPAVEPARRASRSTTPLIMPLTDYARMPSVWAVFAGKARVGPP